MTVVMINCVFVSNTCNESDGDVHLVDGVGEATGDGSYGDEESTNHNNWPEPKSVGHYRSKRSCEERGDRYLLLALRYDTL